MMNGELKMVKSSVFRDSDLKKQSQFAGGVK
jgi:hypothetical protein